MERRLYELLLLLIALVMVFCGPVSLYAQDEFTLEEVVVTAEKIEEDLQKVSQSMTVITSKDMEIRATENVRQVLQNTAGLSFYGGHDQFFIRGFGTVTDDQGLEPAIQFNIDDNPMISTGGFGIKPMTQATNDVERVEVIRGPSGSVYGRSAAAGTVNVITKNPDFDELDGHVGITLGDYDTIRLNAATNLPLKLTGLNLPSFLENLSFRVAAAEDKHEGYVHNELGEPTGAMQNSFNIRVKMKWQPIESLTIGAIYSYTKDASLKGMANYVPAVDVTTYGLFGPGSPFSTEAHPDDPWLKTGSTAYGNVTATDKQYTESINIAYSTRFGTFTGRYAYTYLPVYCTPGQAGCWEGNRGQKDYELRLNSPEDSHIKWNAGVYYFHKWEYTGPDTEIGQINPDREIPFTEIYGSNWVEGFDTGLPNPGMDLNDTSLPFITAYLPYRDPSVYQNGIVFESGEALRPIDSWSAFANATIPLFEDKHRLVLGLRKTYEDKKRMLAVGVWGWDAEGTNNGYPHFHFEYNTTGDLSRGVWVCDNCYLVDAEQPQEKTTEDDPVDWTLGWEYDWKPDVMLYASARHGFKPGGYAPNAVPNTYYEPETVISYALGMKSRWFGQRLQLNVEAYYYDYTNYQLNLNINEGPVTYEVNGVAYHQPYVGMSAVTWNFKPMGIPGIDIDYDWLITPVDRLRGNMAFKRGRYNGVDCDLGHGTFPPDAPRYPDYDDEHMAWSPDFTFYGSYSHMFNFVGYTVTPQLDAKYSSRYYLFWENWWGSVNQETWQEPYWKFDAYVNVGPQDGTWSLNLYCKNLTEEVVRNGSFFMGVSLEEPRTIGASLKIRF